MKKFKHQQSLIVLMDNIIPYYTGTVVSEFRSLKSIGLPIAREPFRFKWKASACRPFLESVCVRDDLRASRKGWRVDGCATFKERCGLTETRKAAVERFQR